MKYRITLEILKDIEGKTYPDSEKIYEQVIETNYIDIVSDIIKAANQLED